MNNRLLMNRIYLSGCMDRVPDGGVTWRNELIPWLNSRGIIVLNPCEKPCNIGCENPESRKIRHDAKMDGDYSNLLKDREVRSVDLRMTDICDAMIVNLDMTQTPCGTYEELFWANREKKPIIVRVEQGKNHAPDWLWWTIPHQMIFNTWDEVKGYIDHIAFDDDDKIDRMKRWIFFDFNKVTTPALNGWDIFCNGGCQAGIDDVKNWLPGEENAKELIELMKSEIGVNKV